MKFSEIALQKVREDRLLIDRVDLWLYGEIEPFLGKRVLEIGCGLGNFARYLAERELYIGTDVSDTSVAHLNSSYGANANIRAYVADVTGNEFGQFARFNLDTIFSLNVLEHIEDDLQALRNANAALKPCGTLILVVPAHSHLYGTMDLAIGHYRRYDKRGMIRLLQASGFEPLRLKYLNLAGAIGWFINGRLRRQITPPSGQLRIFNTLVPLLQRVERIVPVPFGISLLAVSRKPESSHTGA